MSVTPAPAFLLVGGATGGSDAAGGRRREERAVARVDGAVGGEAQPARLLVPVAVHVVQVGGDERHLAPHHVRRLGVLHVQPRRVAAIQEGTQRNEGTCHNSMGEYAVSSQAKGGGVRINSQHNTHIHARKVHTQKNTHTHTNTHSTRRTHAYTRKTYKKSRHRVETQ